jgi:predicted PurR-regulated permease PerM
MQYLATKSDSWILGIVAQAASAMLVVYCTSYIQNWHLRFLHPWWPKYWARVADLLIFLAIILPLLFVVIFSVATAIKEIAKAQATIPSTVPPTQVSPGK